MEGADNNRSSLPRLGVETSGAAEIVDAAKDLEPGLKTGIEQKPRLECGHQAGARRGVAADIAFDEQVQRVQPAVAEWPARVLLQLGTDGECIGRTWSLASRKLRESAQIEPVFARFGDLPVGLQRHGGQGQGVAWQGRTFRLDLDAQEIERRGGERVRIALEPIGIAMRADANLAIHFEFVLAKVDLGRPHELVGPRIAGREGAGNSDGAGDGTCARRLHRAADHFTSIRPVVSGWKSSKNL